MKRLRRKLLRFHKHALPLQRELAVWCFVDALSQYGDDERKRNEYARAKARAEAYRATFAAGAVLSDVAARVTSVRRSQAIAATRHAWSTVMASWPAYDHGDVAREMARR